MILGIFTLILLFWWIWKARKRLVIENFTDYTGDQPKSDARGLATLVVVRLAHLRELYQAVDEKRAIPTSVGVNQSVDATIKVDNVSEFLKDAVSAQSRLTLGPLEIPVGTLFSLIGRIVQGPRIIGSLHKDNNQLILAAQRVGDKQSISWRVDRPILLSLSSEQTNPCLDDMVTELAYKMFTDLALSRTVDWVAVSSFSEGLQAYRECLRTPKIRRIKLQEAERKFIKTLAEDQKFDLAYYNLGVVYTELKQTEAAEMAFLNTIKQNPSSWVARYALALSRYETEREASEKKEAKKEKKKQQKRQVTVYDSIVQLCDRVISLKPGIVATAKAYRLQGKAQIELDDLKKSRKSLRRAVKLSWKALCKAEISGQGVAPLEDNGMSQLETLASVCLSDLAILQSSRAKEFERQAKNRNKIIKICAQMRRKSAYLGAYWLFKQALSLKRSDANYYAYYFFEFGKMYYEWGRYDKALNQLSTAARIIPDNVEFKAYLAIAYAQSYKNAGDQEDKKLALDVTKQTLALASEASGRSFRETFEKLLQTCELIKQADEERNLPDTELHLPIWEMKKFLEKAREAENYLIRDELSLLERKLCEYDSGGQEWEYAQISRSLGRLYQDSNERRKANEYFNKPIERLEKKLREYDGEDHEWERGHVSRFLGTLYLDLDEPELAEKHFKMAIETLKEKYMQEVRMHRLKVSLAYSLLNQGKADEALLAVEHAILLDPLSHFERVALGDIYFKLDEFEHAIEAWQDGLLRRNARMMDPDSPEIYFKIGHAYVKLAQHRHEISRRNMVYQQAISYLKQAIEFYESNQRQKKLAACYFLGYFYFALCDYEEAISYLSLSRTFKFARLTSTFYLGYAYLRHRDYDESIETFRSLQRYAEELKETWRNEGKPIYNTVEYEFDSIGHISLGEMLALAQWGQAFAYAERNMNLEDALNLINKAQDQMKELNEELSSLSKDESTEIQYPAKYPDCKGWIHYRLGEFDAAIICLKHALTLTAQAEIYLHLALAHEGKLHELQKSKDWTEAQTMVRQVRTYCQQVQELDINKQCEQNINDLLQRLQEQSQEIQQMMAQEVKQPG
jgi:tetratricopeptide (TPR) repeat protein